MKRIVILYLFFFVGAFAQEKEELTGHVFEIENDSLSPLTGVHVYYLATKQGSITDDKGFFKLKHDHSNHVLVFSFIGYEPDTLTIEHDQEINVVMGEGKILKDFEVEFKKGAYSFSKIDPRHAHIIGQDELRKAACCNLAESFETQPFN
ncbi:MAG: carboxypeptidase-like regulatory domain-containing protein [Parvicellaceae bacterium]